MLPENTVLAALLVVSAPDPRSTAPAPENAPMVCELSLRSKVAPEAISHRAGGCKAIIGAKLQRAATDQRAAGIGVGAV